MSDTETEVSHESIARDQMDYLKENRGVCASICIHAGNHCKIRYAEGEWEYLTTGEWREKHFHRVSDETVHRLFSENTVGMEPITESKWLSSRDETAWESHGRVPRV